MGVGIEFCGLAVLVSDWSARASLALAGGAVLPAFSVGVEGDNSGLSWWNTTLHITGAASVNTTLFYPTLVVVLGSVRDLGLPIYGG